MTTLSGSALNVSGSPSFTTSPPPYGFSSLEPTPLLTASVMGVTSSPGSNEIGAAISLQSTTQGPSGGGKVSLFVGNDVMGSSGNAWAINSVLVLDSVAGGRAWTTLQGYELDVQNNSGVAFDGTTGGAVIGMNIAGGGPTLTNALLVTSQSATWNNGVQFAGSSIRGTSIIDQSNSIVSFEVYGTHNVGLDTSHAQLAAASVLIGNTATNGAQTIAGVNAAGTAVVNLLEINGGNNVVIGSPGVNTVQSYANFSPVIDATYDLGLSYLRFANIYLVNSPVVSSARELKMDVKDLPLMLPIVQAIDPKSFRWKSEVSEFEDVPQTERVHEKRQVSEEVLIVEMRHGIAVQVRKTVVREVPVFDQVPLFNELGLPVLETVPAKAEVKDSGGRTIRPASPEFQRQVMHPIPRMVDKTVMVRKPVQEAGRQTHLGFMASDIKQAFDKLGMDFGGHVEDDRGFAGLRPDEQIPILWKAIQELAAMVEALQRS